MPFWNVLAQVGVRMNSAPVLAGADFCTAGAAGEFGGILGYRSRAAAVDASLPASLAKSAGNLPWFPAGGCASPSRCLICCDLQTRAFWLTISQRGVDSASFFASFQTADGPVGGWSGTQAQVTGQAENGKWRSWQRQRNWKQQNVLRAGEGL